MERVNCLTRQNSIHIGLYAFNFPASVKIWGLSRFSSAFFYSFFFAIDFTSLAYLFEFSQLLTPLDLFRLQFQVSWMTLHFDYAGTWEASLEIRLGSNLPSCTLAPLGPMQVRKDEWYQTLLSWNTLLPPYLHSKTCSMEYSIIAGFNIDIIWIKIPDIQIDDQTTRLTIFNQISIKDCNSLGWGTIIIDNFRGVFL